jgi:hypothetical protein
MSNAIHLALLATTEATPILCGGETLPAQNLKTDDALFVEIMKIFYGEPRKDPHSKGMLLDRERILYTFDMKNVTCKYCKKAISKNKRRKNEAP